MTSRFYVYKHSGSSGIDAPAGGRIQEDVGVFSPKKILVVRNANVDFVIGIQQAPGLGKTILCCSFRKTRGGKGTNQTYACRCLGGDTAFLNAVGDNSLGGKLVRDLQQVNADIHAVRTMGGTSTDMAVVCAGEKGSNSMTVVPGANNLCDVDYLRRNRMRFEGSDIVLPQTEVLFESVCYTVELASGLYKTAILNPTPASDNLPDEVYTGLDYLTPNESESKRLTGCPTDEMEGLTVRRKPSLEKGTWNIITTLESHGALRINREGHTLCRSPGVQAVGTIAAGDAFSTALTWELADGRSTGETIVFTSTASTPAVSGVGVQGSIPSYEKISDFKKRME